MEDLFSYIYLDDSIYTQRFQHHPRWCRVSSISCETWHTL